MFAKFKKSPGVTRIVISIKNPELLDFNHASDLHIQIYCDFTISCTYTNISGMTFLYSP